MDCTDAKLRMEPYATGNLASPDREEFEKHIAECEGCRLEQDLMRAGIGGGRSDEPPANPPEEPSLEVMRSGDPGFLPGAAFGASLGLDEASFADVASQLSEEGPLEPTSFEQAAPPLPPPSPPRSEPPPPPAAPDPPENPIEPAARSLPGTEDRNQDYSLDSLLAGAVPAAPQPEASTPSPLDALVPPAAPGDGPMPAPPAAPPQAGPIAAAPRAWDFEPAEAGRGAAPPEESLFFAEETLARARDSGARRKSGAVRLALWVAGASVGVALLLFAGWIAWHGRPSEQTERMVVQRYAVPDRHTTVEPLAPQPAPDRPAPAAPEPAAGGESPTPTPPSAPEQTRTAPAAPSEPPALSAATVAPRTPLAEGTHPSPPAVRPKASPAERPAPREDATPVRRSPRPQAPEAGSVQASKPPPASPPARRAEPTAPTVEPRATAPGGTPPPAISGETARPPAPANAPGHDAAAPSPGASPPSAAPRPPDRTGEEGQAAPSGPSAAPESPALGGAAQQPREAPPSEPPTGTSPAGETAGAPAADSRAEQPAPAPARPIDRLHLATVAAEQRGDLSALRDMRDTWKHFLEKSGVGPDRIRAKRELADCLWAIQALSGRKSDQRDALRAYRDYLLNAPAGGADRRSVSRTKQLQDALSDSN